MWLLLTYSILYPDYCTFSTGFAQSLSYCGLYVEGMFYFLMAINYILYIVCVLRRISIFGGNIQLQLQQENDRLQQWFKIIVINLMLG